MTGGYIIGIKEVRDEKQRRKHAGILFLLGIGAELMPIQDWLWSGIFWLLALAWLIYWLGHRRATDLLEVKIIPNKWLENIIVNGKPIKNPSYTLVPGHSLSAIFGLSLLNHSRHKIHVESANVVLKTKTWFWNRKTLLSIPLKVQSHPNDYLLQNVDVEALSKNEYTVNTGADMPIITAFPRRSRLIVTINLIGDTRSIEQVLQNFRHDPKQVPDIPDWTKQGAAS